MKPQPNSADQFWQSVIRKPGAPLEERAAPEAAPVTPATPAEDATAAEPPSEDSDGYRAIRIDPRRDRQLMLELRYRDPVSNQAVTELVPYALIGRVQLIGPYLRLRLSDTGETVVIEGRHLDRALEPLKSATLNCLEEWNRNYHSEVPETEPKITHVAVLEPQAGSKRD